MKEIGAVTNVDEATRQTQTTDAPSTRDRGRNRIDLACSWSFKILGVKLLLTV